MSKKQWVFWNAFLLCVVVYASSWILYTEWSKEPKPAFVNAAGSVDRDVIFPELSPDGTLSLRSFYLDDDEKSGSAMLLYGPNGETILVDSGTKKTVDQLLDYLDYLGIEKIDLAIATHPHVDHIGGFQKLIEEGFIDEMWMPNVKHKTFTFKRFERTIKKHRVSVTYIGDGDELTFGSLKFEVYNPPKETKEKAPKVRTVRDMNNSSTVMKVLYGRQSVLLTGDLYRDGEADLLVRHPEDLRATVMEAPHHGAFTSSSKQFIEAVSPKLVFMNANIFQSKSVYNRYVTSGAKVFVNAFDGTVVMKTDGDEWEVSTERSQLAEEEVLAVQ
ncbi:ComEC/Rec2 family competence protein [Bacillus fonticola]|uniref:ComEC/Rec2 family competence protein n=1 Tax=Bacillus fonticola TaxID=2728853 RepID=UPI0014764BBE|nr:MBL fold metallo-hydrolase [Bacillus fonticola]